LLRLRALEHEYLEAICQRVGPDRCTALNGGRFPLPQAPDGWNQPFPTPRADDPVEPPPDAGLEGQDVRPDDPTAADDDPGPPPEWSERGSTSHPGAEPPQGVPDPDPPPG
jgi:hypothetical protein